MSSIGTQKVNNSESGAVRGALTDWREAETIAAPWRDLAGDLIEENPFYEPWTLLPALKAYAGGKVQLACVWDGPGRDRLLALAPVEARRGYARLAVDHWAMWTHPHCFYAAPLIRRGHGREAAEVLLDLLCEGAQGRAFLRLRSIDPDGPAAQAFRAAALDGRHSYVAGVYERAALFAGPAPEEYLAQAVRKKKRKELSRLRNRLAEQGEISVCLLSDENELASWMSDFLALEDKSWKRARGTSLKSSDADTGWFRESLAGAFNAGKLQFLRIACAGRPVAMLVSFAGARGGFQVKIAHDPVFARYSPGVMIEIEATKRLLADPDFALMDSCAAPNHPMIDSLWKDRRRIAGLNISGKGAAGRTALRLCQTLERVRGALGKPPPKRENRHDV